MHAAHREDTSSVLLNFFFLFHNLFFLSFFLFPFIIFFLDFIGVHIDYDVDSISYDDFINRELILFSHAGEKVIFLFDYLTFSLANLIVLSLIQLYSCHPFCKNRMFYDYDIKHILNIIVLWSVQSFHWIWWLTPL